MSTEIYSNKKDTEDSKTLSIRRFGDGKHAPNKCSYSVMVKDRITELDAKEMREMVETLTEFFKENGYP